ncbi:MAG: hypothetical protein AAF518_02095 [Spirochaetota bacterium]
MIGKASLNPFSSLMIATGSGVGLAILLTFAPVKNANLPSKAPILPKASTPQLKVKFKQNQPLEQSDKKPDEEPISYFRVVPQRQGLPLQPDSQFYSSRSLPFTRTETLGQMEHFSFSNAEQIYYSERRDKLSWRGMVTPNSQFDQSQAELFFPAKRSPIVTKEVSSYEISYQVTPNSLTAIVRSSVDKQAVVGNYDEVNVTMAGFGLRPSKNISTNFFAGDKYYKMRSFASENYYQYLKENYYEERKTTQRSMFEWQTSFNPSRNVGFETSYYNMQGNENLNLDGGTEGAKFSVYFGIEHFLINLKYNYLAQDLLKSIKNSSEDLSSSDFAALGFIFFLDSDKQYSLYIGNNFHNIVTPINYPTSASYVPSTNSFTAMFRGRNRQLLNSTFFFNFRNQLYRDMIYSNIGAFTLPIIVQNYQEYSTSMGLELIF